MNTTDLLQELTKKLDEKKALDIKVIDIGKVCDVADYFLICSAGNNNQLDTLLETVEEILSKAGVAYATEGRGNSGWVLIDCIDIVIHIFGEKEREFYDLEHMWQDGVFVDIERFLPKRQ